MANSTTTTSDEGVNSVNAIVLPIFAGFAIIGLYMPMHDFFRKRNFAMCSMIIAVTVLNFYAFVNALIWRNDDFDTWFSGEGLCDIEVNTRYMMSTVLCTSMTCFTKNLADVFDSENTAFMQTTAMKRRKLAIDIVFCWGAAVLQIALHYVVATTRYAIQPIWGCDDELDMSWPFLVFYWLPFIIFNSLTLYYAGRMLIGLRKHRSNISSTLASSGSGMSTRYFLKLAIIAFSLLIVWIPLQIYWLYRQDMFPLHPYDWSSLHNPASWNNIKLFHISYDRFIQYNAWASVLLSFMIFCYFGFNNDAIDKYRSWLVKCGLGKIFPSLKESRAQRRRQGGSSRGSLSSHFDLVSKAMHYFDGSRKNSHVTGSTGPSENTQSRKGSLATFDQVSLAQINSNRRAPTPDTFATHPSSRLIDQDLITPAPPQTPEPVLAHQTPESPPNKKTFLSSFRTHIHLFAAPLTSPPTRNKRIDRSNLTDIDIDAHPGTRLPFSSPLSPASTVKTNIWSGAHANTNPKHAVDDIESGPDSPMMGTRAYRERERRERELEAVLEEERVRVGEDEEGVLVRLRLERRESEA